MEKLVAWQEVDPADREQVESPFFAKIRVDEALRHDRPVEGLRALERVLTGHGVSRSVEWRHQAILDCIEQARWLLVTPQPLRPFTHAGLGHHPHLPWCRPGLHCSVSDPLSIGPGKWRTIDISVDKFQSGMAFVANYLTSRGDDQLFFAAGQHYSNTRRTITQQWVPLLEEESRMHLHAARRVYGQTRRIKQRYVEADDHWPQEGKSWHWRPVVADTVYEYRGGGFWP